MREGEDERMTVYMVHGEVGKYSDWTYKVEGIFSSYQRAKMFLESKTLDLWMHTVQARNESREKAGLAPIDEAIARAYGLPSWRPRPIDGVETRHVQATLVTDDYRHFYYTVAGSSYRIYGDIWEYFITEYELDEVVE